MEAQAQFVRKLLGAGLVRTEKPEEFQILREVVIDLRKKGHAVLLSAEERLGETGKANVTISVTAHHYATCRVCRNS